jgi:hypothetical protein
MRPAIGEPNNQSQVLETISTATESCFEPGRSTVEPHRASSVVEGLYCGGLDPVTSHIQRTTGQMNRPSRP